MFILDELLYKDFEDSYKLVVIICPECRYCDIVKFKPSFVPIQVLGTCPKCRTNVIYNCYFIKRCLKKEVNRVSHS